MWGIMGIGYNIGKVIEVFGEDVLFDSWDLVFDLVNMEKFVECGVYFLDVLIEMIFVVLNYIGEDFDSYDLDVIVKVEVVYDVVCFYI